MLRGAVFLLWLLIAIVFPGPSVAASKPDVVLITLDSTRADRMGFLGSHKGLTPALDAIAGQSIVFERAYAQAPLTLVSHATILSGTYPQMTGASELGVATTQGIPNLPELLHGHGYRTAAFLGSIDLDPRNGLASGFDRGFDVYDAIFRLPQRGQDRYETVELHGDEVVARAIKWLTRNPQHPLFLWVNLCDLLATRASSYNSAVNAADAAVGKLIGFLREQKLYDNSLIVVASDHGESLGAHGEDTHGIFLYDETIHVPLVVKLPQSQMPGKRVGARVRLLDIAPTIVEVAGVPVPSEMQGQSLLRIAKTGTDQPAYARSDLPAQGFGWSGLESWRAGKYLYVRAPKPELYDLSADPNATHNLAQSLPATLETMAAQLAAFDNHLSGKSTVPGLTSSEVEKLASLGYVGLQMTGVGANPGAEGTDPKDVIARANQVMNAFLAVGDGKPEQAIPAFNEALAGQSDLYLAQYGVGTALVEEQRYSKAIEHLHKAIQLQPNSVWAHYQMGLCLLNTGDFKAAAIHLEIVSARLTESVVVHSMLAKAYAHLGRVQDADHEHAKATDLAHHAP